jgi:hypothetical protein
MEVIVTGWRSTTDAWEKAKFAPAAELPPLTSDQEEAARKFGLTSEEYARSFYSGELSKPELKGKAEGVARLVEKMVREYLPGATLYRAVLETYRGVLRLFVKAAEQEVVIDVDEDLVDDLRRTGSKDLLDRLERIVRLSLPSRDGESLAS